MCSKLRFVFCAIAIGTMMLSSGCATIVKGSKQNISVQTDPEGASCDLMREGQHIGSVSPTPGNIEVEKDKDTIEVTCKKKGFKDSNESVSSSFQEWTLGNILIGGLVGVAIDAGSGAAMQYPPAVVLKLTPDTFGSEEARQDFYDQWRDQILQNSTKAKIAASKTCEKEKCEEIVKRIDRETEQALAGIEANRNLKTAAATALPPAATERLPVQSGQAGPVTTAVVTESGIRDGRWAPQRGDRWRYRMLDGRKVVGTLNIQVEDASSGRVTERITKDGSPSFAAEREVRSELVTNAFQSSVSLPGGYRLFELSPYFPPDASLAPGTSLGQISGQLDILTMGMRSLVWETRVVRQEKVRVPAGEFDAWLVEGKTSEVSQHGPLNITWRAWYSPAAQRPVKVYLDFNSRIDIGKSNETLELMAFENGK